VDKPISRDDLTSKPLDDEQLWGVPQPEMPPPQTKAEKEVLETIDEMEKLIGQSHGIPADRLAGEGNINCQ